MTLPWMFDAAEDTRCHVDRRIFFVALGLELEDERIRSQATIHPR